MNWDAIGAIGEVIGALAVVATLGYLAKQIQQQNRSSEGDAVREVFSAWTDAISACVSDQATSELMMRGLQDYDSLDSIGERGVFHGKLLQLFNAHMTFAEMAEQGLVSSEKADAIADEMAQILNSPGAATWWAMVGPLYKTTYELIEARRDDVAPDEHPTFRLIRGGGSVQP